MLYQFLPRLSDEEYRALEASIAEHGIQVPILVDEHKAVIDGHHRKEIADRLGIDCPRRFAIDLTDEQKRTLALSLNLDRRHLSREQKRELVERSLKADPSLSDRQHAERTGVSPTTVGSARSRLEESGDVSNLDTRTDSAGRTQPASKPKSPEPADLGEGDAGSGQHSTEACPADDVDTQAAPAEDEAPGATSDDATAATPEREGHRAPGHNLRPAPAADDEFTEQDRAEELAGNLARNLSLLYAVTNPDRRAEYIAAWVPGTRSRPTLGQNFVTPRHMRALAEALQTFATEWEHAHA